MLIIKKLVDKEPLGLRGEVVPALRLLKDRGTPLVLGLRDVMDDPAQLAKEWERKNVVPALRDLYDELRGGETAIVDEVEGPASMTLGGFPDIRTRVSEDIRGDMRTFVPLGLGIILIFLWACFRQVRGVLLPHKKICLQLTFADGKFQLIEFVKRRREKRKEVGPLALLINL